MSLLRRVALATTCAVLLTACSSDDATTAPDPAGNTASEADAPPTAAALQVTRTPLGEQLPDGLQMPDPAVEALVVDRILPLEAGWRIVGSVDDGTRRAPTVFDLDDDLEVTERRDLEVPSDVVRVATLAVSQDDTHLFGIGIDGSLRSSGLVWSATEPFDLVATIPDVRVLTDVFAHGQQTLAIGRALDGDRAHPAGWDLADPSAPVRLGQLPDHVIPAVGYVEDGVLHVWSNDLEAAAPRLLTAVAPGGLDALADAALPEALTSARTVTTTATAPIIGRYLGGSTPSDNLYVAGLWRNDGDGWVDESKAFAGTRTFELSNLEVIGNVIHQAVAYAGSVLTWAVYEDGEIAETRFVGDNVVGVKANPTVGFSLRDGALRLGGELVQTPGLPPVADVTAATATVNANGVQVIEVPSSREALEREDRIVVDGEVVAEVPGSLVHGAALPSGEVLVVGSLDKSVGDGFERASAWLVSADRSVTELDLAIDGGTSRLNTVLVRDGAFLALGHRYDGAGPEMLAVEVQPDGTFALTTPGGLAPENAVRGTCGDGFTTFGAGLVAGVAVPLDDGFAHVSLGRPYPDSAASAACVPLDDGRVMVVLDGQVLVVGQGGILQDDAAEVSGVGVRNGALTTLADGRSAAMVLAHDPSGAGWALAVFGLDDLTDVRHVPLDLPPGTKVQAVVQPDPGVLVLSVTVGRITTLETVSLA